MLDPTPPPDLDAIEVRITRLCLRLTAWEASGTLPDGDALSVQLDRDSTALVARVRALEAEVARLQARVGAAVPPVQRPTQAHAHWRTHRTGPNRGDKPCRRCSTLMLNVPGNKQYCSPACQQADAKDGYGRGPYGPWP